MLLGYMGILLQYTQAIFYLLKRDYTPNPNPKPLNGDYKLRHHPNGHWERPGALPRLGPGPSGAQPAGPLFWARGLGLRV